MKIVDYIRGLFSRSIENPMVPLSDAADDLIDGWGKKSTAGVRVTPETALTLDTVWRAVNLISTSVAKLPLFVQRRGADGEQWERDKSHPAYRILRHKFNREETSFTARQRMEAHKLLRGNAYGWIQRDGAGRPLQIIPQNPDSTYPCRIQGELWYAVFPDASKPRKDPAPAMVRAEDMLHVKGLGFDGLSGYSVIAKARDSLGLPMAAEEYGARFFSNNARPTFAIEFPENVKVTETLARAIQASWERIYRGNANAHRVAILQRGAKPHALSLNAQDAQLLETRKFAVATVANWFGIPPHKLGDDSRTSYNSLEMENQSYIDDCLDGHLCAWEAECRDKLLTADEQDSDSHTVEFLRAALVRADLKTRSASYRLALGSGVPWQTINEIRSAESLPRLEDPEADKLRLPLATQSAGGGADNDEKPPAPAEGDEGRGRDLRGALVVVVDEARARMLRRLCVHARKAARKPESFGAWLDAIESEHGATIRAALAPPVRALLLADDRRTTEDQITAGIDARVAGLIEGVRRSLGGESSPDTSPEDLAARIDGLENWSRGLPGSPT
jgi:HK97 family phage portal protein